MLPSPAVPVPSSRRVRPKAVASPFHRSPDSFGYRRCLTERGSDRSETSSLDADEILGLSDGDREQRPKDPAEERSTVRESKDPLESVLSIVDGTRREVATSMCRHGGSTNCVLALDPPLTSPRSTPRSSRTHGEGRGCREAGFKRNSVFEPAASAFSPVVRAPSSTPSTTSVAVSSPDSVPRRQPACRNPRSGLEALGGTGVVERSWVDTTR